MFSLTAALLYVDHTTPLRRKGGLDDATESKPRARLIYASSFKHCSALRQIPGKMVGGCSGATAPVFCLPLRDLGRRHLSNGMAHGGCHGTPGALAFWLAGGRFPLEPPDQ